MSNKFDAVNESTARTAGNSDVSSILSDHAMELAVTAGGGTAGGLAGWGSLAAYGGLQRGLISVYKYPMAIGFAMLGGGHGVQSVLTGAEEMIQASREAQAARMLPGIAIGAVVGGAIAYGGYRWLTEDSKTHEV